MLNMNSTKSDKKYYEAVGRRKTATARVRLFPQNKTTYSVNGKDLQLYFPIREMQDTVSEALANVKAAEKFLVSIKVKGGGLSSQAEAIRHGISRALLEYDVLLRGPIKKLGFLKRDPRAKERRKFGLKKARKAPQWSKR